MVVVRVTAAARIDFAPGRGGELAYSKIPRNHLVRFLGRTLIKIFVLKMNVIMTRVIINHLILIMQAISVVLQK